jgi:hypothetical protein
MGSTQRPDCALLHLAWAQYRIGSTSTRRRIRSSPPAPGDHCPVQGQPSRRLAGSRPQRVLHPLRLHRSLPRGSRLGAWSYVSVPLLEELWRRAARAQSSSPAQPRDEGSAFAGDSVGCISGWASAPGLSVLAAAVGVGWEGAIGSSSAASIRSSRRSASRPRVSRLRVSKFACAASLID